MKRKLSLLLCLVLCFSALVSCDIGSHDVQVGIIQTTLHRENPKGPFGTELYPYDTPISDGDIKASASGYDTYVEGQSNVISPGFLRLKEIYVENQSKEDIYVRVVATFPAAFCKKDNPIMHIYYSEEAAKDTDRGFSVSDSYDEEGNYIMVFTYLSPLSANEMTYWPSLQGFGIDSDVIPSDIETAFGELGNKPFDVTVVANAVAVKDYKSAEEAFRAYDEQKIK